MDETRCAEEGCEAPDQFLTESEDEKGVYWCPAHDPQTGSEEMAERGRKGGQNRVQALDSGSLPDITDFASAKRVLEIAIQGAADGSLPPKRCNSIIRGIRVWREMREAELAEGKIEEMEEEIRQLKREKNRQLKPWQQPE